MVEIIMGQFNAKESSVKADVCQEVICSGNENLFGIFGFEHFILTSVKRHLYNVLYRIRSMWAPYDLA